MTATPATEARHDAALWRRSLAVLAAATLVRLVVAALIPLFPDETYYWEWSRNLAGGYFDHPPAIAVSIAAGRALLGDTRLGVRLVPVLLGGVASLAAAAIALRIGGARAAWRAALAMSVLPLAAAGLVLATPDAPLLGTTAVGLYFVVRALQAAPRSRASLGWWTAAGVALGCAFASKYTSILLPVSVVLAVLLHRELRARLTEPGPYVACLVATLVFAPVLLWNAQHDWVSFAFQVQHGLGRPRGSPLKRELDLVGGQAGLVSPILFVLVAIAVWRALRGRDGVRFLLGVVAAATFAFFAYSATRRPVEANWPAPAYIPGVALLGATLLAARGERWLRAGYWLAGVLSAVVYLHATFGLLPLAPRRDPIARSHGWDVLGDSMFAAAAATSRAAGGAGANPGVWLAADRYQDAAEIAYNAPQHPLTFAVNLSGRRNQYDLWPGFEARARRGDALVLALDETPDVHTTVARLAPFFASAERASLVELPSRRGAVGMRRIWVLRGWRGGWPAAEMTPR